MMIGIFFRAFVFPSMFIMGSSYLSAHEIDLQSSGITDYYPSCKLEKKTSLCIDGISIDEEKRALIEVKSDFDSAPELLVHNLKDTSSKVKVATSVMRNLIERLNPRADNELQYKQVPIRLEHASSKNIVILMKVSINGSSYAGFSYINDDGSIIMGIKETILEPDDYFYSELVSE
ncbi:hypothetical protein F0267_21660 [Vibrio coralliilyticus]|uniref:Uncharacterized protein n=1 Tax=Vibrio coralliilyticus TaxID=190893 RepID=A0AAN0SE05_9VIBR|nr:hypothetical protein [Vibrio coralliilyticus]AIW19110.1 hypothetical protein IX92_08615 [Vibrio coralliilyticus]NOH40832.1 hypothetical protein [Vibrio coralliilyticus]